MTTTTKDMPGSTAKRGSDRPPGPPWFGVLKTFATYSRDALSFLQRTSIEYGDIVYYRVGIFPIYLVTSPTLIEEMLVAKNASFQKDEITRELSDLLGQGLLTSGGDHWKRQRRLAAPSLTRKQIAAYADQMVADARTISGELVDGAEVDIHEVATELTLRIVVKTLFDLEFHEGAETVRAAIDEAMEYFHLRVHTMWRFLPEWIPTSHRRRYLRAIKELDDLIFGLIAEKRSAEIQGDDLLSRLIAATDEDGHQMDDQQLRDEALTLFLAGHETTALVVTYVWHALSKHPEIADRFYDEIDGALGGREATMADLAALPWTKAIVEETMRLYPPAWIIGREAIEDVQLGPWTLPKGSQVIAPQWVVHRDARWFENPETFDPSRWMNGGDKERPRFAYYPFGGGARICIGNHFAMMEAILCIATMGQHARFAPVGDEPLEFAPSVTLRPASPVQLCVERRPARELSQNPM